MTVVLFDFANINMCGAAVCWVAVCCTRSQVSTPSAAVEFLKRYDDDVKASREVHRVGHHSVGQGKVGLPGQLARLAPGQGFVEELRSELMAYSLCRIDEACVEAVHRDVSHISHRGVAAKLAYIASSLRLNQN